MNYTIFNLLSKLNRVDKEQEKIHGDLMGLKKELIQFKNNYQNDKTISDAEQVLLQNLCRLPFHFYFITDVKTNRILHSNGLEVIVKNADENSNYSSFLKRLHPEDHQTFLELEMGLSKSNSAKNNEENQAMLISHFRVKKTNGEYIPIMKQSCFFQVDEDGNPSTILHLCNDLSGMIKENKVSFVLDSNGKDFSLKNCQEDKISLTKREMQILKLIAEGKSSVEIGNELFISRETVDKHRKNMIKKSGVVDTHKLAIKALSENWI